MIARRTLMAGFTSVRSLATTGGHCDDTNEFRTELFYEPVRHHIKYGAELIKRCATGGVLSLNAGVGWPLFERRKAAAHAPGNEAPGGPCGWASGSASAPAGSRFRYSAA